MYYRHNYQLAKFMNCEFVVIVTRMAIMGRSQYLKFNYYVKDYFFLSSCKMVEMCDCIM